MHIVSARIAKRDLSKLVDRVQKGETIIIGTPDKPIARMVPFLNYETVTKKHYAGGTSQHTLPGKNLRPNT